MPGVCNSGVIKGRSGERDREDSPARNVTRRGRSGLTRCLPSLHAGMRVRTFLCILHPGNPDVIAWQQPVIRPRGMRDVRPLRAQRSRSRMIYGGEPSRSWNDSSRSRKRSRMRSKSRNASTFMNTFINKNINPCKKKAYII